MSGQRLRIPATFLWHFSGSPITSCSQKRRGVTPILRSVTSVFKSRAMLREILAFQKRLLLLGAL